MLKSTNLSSLKLGSVEVTLEPILSCEDGSDAESMESNLPMCSGPNWTYGNSVSRPTSKRVPSTSGLCSSERGHVAVAQPEVIQNVLCPSSDSLKDKIIAYRNKFASMLAYEPTQKFYNPLLVVTGPSYVQNAHQMNACAQWVGSMLGKPASVLNTPLPDSIANFYKRAPINNDSLMLAIRANLSKYNLDYNAIKTGVQSVMTFEIEQGMPVCRALLCELAEICPIVGEVADTITPQYLSDLYCLSFISSTLVESQLHRELASGVSYSIGFSTSDSHLPFDKSMYKHKITSALDAIYATSQPHQFLSVTKVGTVAVVGTVGNDETFLILQVNLQLEFTELEELIDYIYSHPRHKFKCPKIMLDVGKISSSDFDSKLQIVSRMLTSPSTRCKIIGVVVDSGDNYVPDVSNPGQNYENFINANKFINSLGELSNERIRLQNK